MISFDNFYQLSNIYYEVVIIIIVKLRYLIILFIAKHLNYSNTNFSSSIAVQVVKNRIRRFSSFRDISDNVSRRSNARRYPQMRGHYISTPQWEYSNIKMNSTCDEVTCRVPLFINGHVISRRHIIVER